VKQAFVTPLAKSVVDETSEAFRGLYNGQLSPDLAVKNQVESSDAIIHIGSFPSDSNTGGWSQNLPEHSLINLRHDRVSVATRSWQGIHFSPIVKTLLELLETGEIHFPQSDREKLTVMTNRLYCRVLGLHADGYINRTDSTLRNRPRESLSSTISGNSSHLFCVQGIALLQK